MCSSDLEFWRSDPSRGGLSGAWSGRSAQFSAQASGVWTPSEADDKAGAQEGWTFEVHSSSNATVNLVIGNLPCAANPCRLPHLPQGPKAVTIQVDDATSSGWFEVLAAPGKEQPTNLAEAAIAPGYALTTVSESNDSLPGSNGGVISRTSYAEIGRAHV